jgi:hypothetical protein
MKIRRHLTLDNFQSSLRDLSCLESLPRTASWAKFSRPLRDLFCRPFSRRLFSPSFSSHIKKAASLGARLIHLQLLVDWHVFQGLYDPTRPVNFNCCIGTHIPQTKMHA